MSKNRNTLPKWMRQIHGRWQAGASHSFFLTGNTEDTFPVGGSLIQLLAHLETVYRSECTVFVGLNKVWFPTAKDMSTFMRVTGLNPLQNPIVGGNQGEPSPTVYGEYVLPGARFDHALISAIETLLQEPERDERGRPVVAQGRVKGLSASVVFVNAHLIWPNTPVEAMDETARYMLDRVIGWTRDKVIGDMGKRLYFISHSGDVHKEITGVAANVSRVNVPLPDAAVRQRYIESLLAQKADVTGDSSPLALANVSGGLRLKDIEDILYYALVGNVPLTVEFLLRKKAEILADRYGGVIELMPSYGMSLDDVGGLDYVVAYLRKEVVGRVRSGELDKMPKGILLAGSPGTGKTHLVTALAGEAGMTCVKFSPQQVLNKYVGETERMMRLFFDAIKALSPVIVFLDEVDQIVQRSTGDEGNGVRGNMFQAILTELSAPDRQFLVIAATNHPERVDETMSRSGRFDVVVPVLPPAVPEAKAEIIIKSARHLGWELSEDDIPVELLAETNGWSGAELNAVIRKAQRIQMPDESIPDALRRAKRNTIIRPGRTYGQMIRNALMGVRDMELIPPGYEGFLGDGGSGNGSYRSAGERTTRNDDVEFGWED